MSPATSRRSRCTISRGFTHSLATQLALVGLLACLACTAPEQPERPDEPNILLISLDACRADRLGCYGAERPTSPFLDRLASQGALYENAFVNTHGTPPSHATMLSSRYQETHRLGWNGMLEAGTTESLSPAVVMVQEILADAGYLTLAVTGGGHMARSSGFDRGFAAYDDRIGRVVAQKKRLLELLDRHPEPDGPMFVLFHTYEIHSPYTPPPAYRDLFGTYDSQLEPTSQSLARYAHSANKLSAADIDHLKALYDAGIRYTDDTLAQMFSELDRRGFFENALIIITADHGEELGDHGGLLHRGLLYEELIHVPFILWGSKAPKGLRSQEMASTIDIAPTVLDAAGIEAPAEMEGRSLLGTRPEPGLQTRQEPEAATSALSTSASQGPAGATRQRPDLVQDRLAVVTQYAGRRYALRTTRWKLIETIEPRRTELYDIVEDPGERFNIAALYPRRVRRMRQTLVRWRNARPAIEPQTTDRQSIDSESGRVGLSTEQIEHLETLGYVDSTSQ